MRPRSRKRLGDSHDDVSMQMVTRIPLEGRSLEPTESTTPLSTFSDDESSAHEHNAFMSPLVASKQRGRRPPSPTPSPSPTPCWKRACFLAALLTLVFAGASVTDKFIFRRPVPVAIAQPSMPAPKTSKVVQPPLPMSAMERQRVEREAEAEAVQLRKDLGAMLRADAAEASPSSEEQQLRAERIALRAEQDMRLREKFEEHAELWGRFARDPITNAKLRPGVALPPRWFDFVDDIVAVGLKRKPERRRALNAVLRSVRFCYFLYISCYSGDWSIHLLLTFRCCYI